MISLLQSILLVQASMAFLVLHDNTESDEEEAVGDSLPRLRPLMTQPILQTDGGETVGDSLPVLRPLQSSNEDTISCLREINRIQNELVTMAKENSAVVKENSALAKENSALAKENAKEILRIEKEKLELEKEKLELEKEKLELNKEKLELDGENRRLREENEKQNRTLQQIMPYLALRFKVEMIESMYGHAFQDAGIIKRLKGIMDVMSYHQKVCLAILQIKNIESINRMRRLLAEEHLSNDDFCISYAGFFVISCNRIHVPSIVNYSEEELMEAVKSMGYKDPSVLKSAKIIHKI